MQLREIMVPDPVVLSPDSCPRFGIPVCGQEISAFAGCKHHSLTFDAEDSTGFEFSDNDNSFPRKGVDIM